MRLHEQYRLLQQHYGEQPVSPGVAELAALLACSPRNVRLQLAKMQQQGWLAWQPGRGRGHRSVLQCLQPPQDLQWQRTHRLLQRGELEQAFASLPPDGRSQLMAQLPAYLGASANRRQLRIPIHRPLATLDPLRVTSRLEAHLVRQVFDRLCSFDIATQTLQPALAHSWQADASARQWRFWLRPGVQFHDGSPLDAWAVAASVQRLHEQAGDADVKRLARAVRPGRAHRQCEQAHQADHQHVAAAQEGERLGVIQPPARNNGAAAPQQHEQQRRQAGEQGRGRHRVGSIKQKSGAGRRFPGADRGTYSSISAEVYTS